jgi:flagellar basal-body rod modification protein FlgD
MSAPTSSVSSATSQLSSLTQSQFLQILLAGLQNQDPLNPVDTSTFLTQMTEFANVEGQQTLNANFTQMLQLQQLTDGASLIGQTISYTASNGSTASGTVGGVSVQNGQIYLGVGSTQVGLSQVLSIAPST